MLQQFVTLRTIICGLLVVGLLAAVACGAPAEQQVPSAPAGGEQQQPAAQAQTAPQPAAPQQPATEAPAAQAPAKPTLAQPAGMTDTKAGGAAPTAVPQPAAPKAETEGTPVQADLRVAITPPYAENLLGWRVGGTNQGILQPMQEQLFQRHYETWEAQAMLATDWSGLTRRQDVDHQAARKRTIPRRSGYLRRVRFRVQLAALDAPRSQDRLGAFVEYHAGAEG